MTTRGLLLFFHWSLFTLHRHPNTCRSFGLLFEHGLVLFPKNSRHGLNFFLLSRYPRDGVGIFTKSRLINDRPESLLKDAIQIFFSLFHIIVININIVCLIIITNHCRYHPLPPLVFPLEDFIRHTLQTTIPPWMPTVTLQVKIAYVSPKLHFFILLSYRWPRSTVLYVSAPSIFDVFLTQYWRLYVRFVFWPMLKLILGLHCICKLHSHRIFRLS